MTRRACWKTRDPRQGIGQIRPNHWGFSDWRKAWCGDGTSRNVSANAAASVEDMLFGGVSSPATRSEIDDMCLRSSSVAKYGFRRKIENACNKSCPSRMRFPGSTGGKSTEPFVCQQALLGFSWDSDSLFGGSASDMPPYKPGATATGRRSGAFAQETGDKKRKS